MANKKRIPTMPLDTRGWLESKATKSLNMEEKGLLIELLCCMWESPERGVMVKLDGSLFNSKDIVLHTLCNKSSLERLVACGAIAIREEDGAYYSPTIMKLIDISEKRRVAGKKGGDSSKAQGKMPQYTETPKVEVEEKPEPEQLEMFPAVEEPRESKKEELTALEQQFEDFRKAYQGTKRGLKTELENLKKKYPKEWRKLIPLFMPAIQSFIEWRRELAKKNLFVPEWPHLTTWINQRRWETEYESTNKPSNGTEWQRIDQGRSNGADTELPGSEGETPRGIGSEQGVYSQKDYSERF